MEIKLY